MLTNWTMRYSLHKIDHVVQFTKTAGITDTAARFVAKQLPIRGYGKSFVKEKNGF